MNVVVGFLLGVVVGSTGIALLVRSTLRTLATWEQANLDDDVQEEQFRYMNCYTPPSKIVTLPEHEYRKQAPE